MDERWSHWYETVLRPLLRYHAQDSPTTELEQLLALSSEQADLALLVADTDRTQAYVFESSKLPEIRGSSELLQELNAGLRRIVTEP